MMLGLRLGDRPRVLIATTPRTTPCMKKLIAMTGVSITTGSTYDNVAHLSPEFLKKVRELYEGTRLGRQELQGVHARPVDRGGSTTTAHGEGGCENSFFG